MYSKLKLRILKITLYFIYLIPRLKIKKPKPNFNLLIIKLNKPKSKRIKTMEKQIKEFWKELKTKAKDEWNVSKKELKNVKGEIEKFEELAQEKFKLSTTEAREKVKELYKEYDQLKWEGREELVKGKAQAMWSNITGDDWEKIKGSKTQFVGYIKEQYGKSQQEALKEFDKFLKNIST